MAEVVSLADHRPPVRYVVYIEHHADGRITIAIPALAGDAKTKRTVVRVLRAIAEELERE